MMEHPVNDNDEKAANHCCQTPNEWRDEICFLFRCILCSGISCNAKGKEQVTNEQKKPKRNIELRHDKKEFTQDVLT